MFKQPLKDFTYYADKAEEQIGNAEKYVEQIYNPHLRDTALAAADIYARLAAAAPVVKRPANEI